MTTKKMYCSLKLMSQYFGVLTSSPRQYLELIMICSLFWKIEIALCYLSLGFVEALQRFSFSSPKTNSSQQTPLTPQSVAPLVL